MKAFRIPTRFAIVGLACAATHTAIMLGADGVGIHYAVSCALSYGVVVALGFALHVRFTFEQRPSLDSFWRYALSMAANYPITVGLLFVMCDVAAWPVTIAVPIATVLMIVWNFLASRWAIVRGLTAAEPAPSSRST